jgi:hypothetical protein
LLRQPHDEDRAGHQREHGRRLEQVAGRQNHAERSLQAERDAEGLKGGQCNRNKAGILIQSVPSRQSARRPATQPRHDAAHQLHDNEGGNIRQDAECEDRYTAHDVTAGEQLEQPEQS